MPFPHFHPYTRQSMSNGDIAYTNRFFYLRAPPRQLSPPVPDHDFTIINCIRQVSADQPIEIYDCSSDEVAGTDLIHPSLRDSPVNPSARITAPTGAAPLFFDQAAPPGLILTQHAPPAEADIPVPNLNNPAAPPAYAAAPAPHPCMLENQAIFLRQKSFPQVVENHLFSSMFGTKKMCSRWVCFVHPVLPPQVL
ncbi:hypothetical protein PCANC_00215 [Puccinia coronata f. sp. avenae]|uniref:Uncharacterized protein n=1 Tax=Puccinia coronata f. sp. avenae TaxID=200324 RepID=A0A2N5W9A7_9BASI|nr:hypothetical protein PCANC_00215 [Puccinia coronata f. sp. avenae]